jgi:hypothetical protein
LPAQVELIGALFVLWGALTILVGVSTLALGVGAAALITSAGRQPGSHVAASLTVAAFVALAAIAIAWGVAHIAVGLPLRRRVRWSRFAALLLASVDVLLPPYGTAIGAYTLWVLLREDAKKLFDLRYS